MTLYSQKPVLEKEVLIIAQYFGSFVPNISRIIWLKLCNRIFKSRLNFQLKKKILLAIIRRIHKWMDIWVIAMLDAKKYRSLKSKKYRIGQELTM